MRYSSSTPMLETRAGYNHLPDLLQWVWLRLEYRFTLISRCWKKSWAVPSIVEGMAYPFIYTNNFRFTESIL